MEDEILLKNTDLLSSRLWMNVKEAPFWALKVNKLISLNIFLNINLKFIPVDLKYQK